MTDPIFVGREQELARLEAALDRASAGNGQLVLVTGEPGSGKSALVQAFLRRAQARHGTLVAALGNCNAQAGIGEAYLPFREILATLTDDLQARQVDDAVQGENQRRIRRVLAASTLILITVAPDLIGTFVPGADIAAKIGKTLIKQAGLEKRLMEAAAKKPASAAQLPAAPLDQNQIFEQCTNFLHAMASQQPLVLALDDLQWADASSISLLFHVVRRFTQSSILIIGTYRPEEVALGRAGERHPLDKVQSEFKRLFGDITLFLQPGEQHQVRQFVDAYVDSFPNRLGYEFREELCRRTRGNPLFLVELLRDMQERGDLIQDEEGRWIAGAGLDWQSLPARVEGAIEERFERLQADLRETLRIASVEGERFTAEVGAHLQSLEAREMVRRLSGQLAELHQLVVAEQVVRLFQRRLSIYRFSHSAMQRYLYDRLDEIELSYLHEDVGNALEGLYEGQLEDIAVQLAWHFGKAGLTSRAAHYLQRAGRLAVARYAYEEALQHLSQALSFLPEEDLPARYETLLLRETVYGWQGRRQDQWRDLGTLAALAGAMEDEAALAEVCLRKADCARLTGDYVRGLGEAQKGVQHAEAAGDARREAAAYGLWGRILTRTGEFVEAHEWLALALDQAGEQQDAGLLADITWSLGNNAYAANRLKDSQGYFEEALEAYRSIHHGRGLANSLLMLGILQSRAGYFLAAQARLQDALATCRSIGWRYGEAHMLGTLGITHLEVADFAQARSVLEQALAICREIGDVEGEAVNLDNIGLTWHHEGSATTALPPMQEALSLHRSIGNRRSEGYTLTHVGHVWLDLGELEQAETAFLDALGIRRALDPDGGTVVDDLVGLAQAARARGDWSQSLRYAEEALGLLSENRIASMEYPVQGYLIIYQALRAAVMAGGAPSAEADAVLETGYRLLQERAANIQDPDLREQYLAGVPFNRQLLEAWQDATAG